MNFAWASAPNRPACTATRASTTWMRSFTHLRITPSSTASRRSARNCAAVTTASCGTGRGSTSARAVIWRSRRQSAERRSMCSSMTRPRNSTCSSAWRRRTRSIRINCGNGAVLSRISSAGRRMWRSINGTAGARTSRTWSTGRGLWEKSTCSSRS